MVPTGPQQDQTGTFYYGQDGKKYYVSPSAMPGGPTSAPPGMQWNQETGAYESNRTIGEKIAPYAAGALLTAGIGNAAMSGVGSAAAKQTVSQIQKQGGGGANVPNSNEKPTTGGGESGGNGGKTVAALLGLAGLLGGKAFGGGGNRVDYSPQMSQLAQMGVDRMAAQTPLFNATNQGIHAMLPNFAKQGTGSPTMLSANAPPPGQTAQTPNGSGSMPWWLPLAVGAGGMALPDILNGRVPFETIIKKLAGLWGGGGDRGFGRVMGQPYLGDDTTVPVADVGADAGPVFPTFSEAGHAPADDSWWNFGTQVDTIPILPDEITSTDLPF